MGGVLNLLQGKGRVDGGYIGQVYQSALEQTLIVVNAVDNNTQKIVFIAAG